MFFHQATLDDCGSFSGVVVVIDVLRAFTTAPVAFSRGVSEIYLVSTVEEALALREQNLSFRTMGEVKGAKPETFDYSNSPFELMSKNLQGLTLIHRTTAGTQGVVRSKKANLILAASFVNAKATVGYLMQKAPHEVTFVATGVLQERDGDEDVALADYMTELLRGHEPDENAYRERIKQSTAASYFGDPDKPWFLPEDLDIALSFNSYDLVLPVHREGQNLIMRAEKV